MSKTYEVEIKTDELSGELFFDLPEGMMKKLDWKPGDDLKWEETDEGFRCRKVNYKNVEIELEEEDYVKYLKYAHDNNMSFNELAETAVKEAMNKNENETI